MSGNQDDVHVPFDHIENAAQHPPNWEHKTLEQGEGIQDSDHEDSSIAPKERGHRYRKQIGNPAPPAIDPGLGRMARPPPSTSTHTFHGEVNLRTSETNTDSGPLSNAKRRAVLERGLGPIEARAQSWAKSSGRSEHRRSSSKRETWQVQKDAISSKFGSAGWTPRKRLSPDALEGIRALHAQFPDKFSTPVLANQFEVSAEAIRRILKSKWRPSDEESTSRRQRWDKRGERIWGQMVALGVKPPKKWRDVAHRKMGVQGEGMWDEDRNDAQRLDDLLTNRPNPNEPRKPLDLYVTL
ncbi:MAG: hypothetical protein Q9169_000271 [Polycauliona sp. 2 TL-2023]